MGDFDEVYRRVLSGEEARTHGMFVQLKVHCVELLELVQNCTVANNKKITSILPQMLQFLRSSPSSGLQPFFDFVLLPLLLVYDAAVDSRSQSEKTQNKFPRMPHKISDSVAEGVLQCLEELIVKCYIKSVDQLVVILKKFTFGALLSPSEASEEFREGVLRCFRALLLGLRPCSHESCSCKKSSFPALLASKTLRISFTRPSEHYTKPEKCLVAFLQSKAAAPAVGHWLSLLLSSADTEAARGHRGSAKLRQEAFLTLRVLVAKVGTADALAFFLPGTVSQFAKVLHASKTMASGAAGNVEVVDHAVRGLAEYLMIVLQNDANLSGLGISLNEAISDRMNQDNYYQSIMEELRRLPTNGDDQTKNVAEASNNAVVEVVTPGSALMEKRNCDPDNFVGSLHVTRTNDWIRKTSIHIDKLLNATLPHICIHPAKKVRKGILAAIQGLLSQCSHTLKESQLLLLECLCVLVCDDCEEVSVSSQKVLEFLFSSRKHQIECEVAEIFNRLIEKLPKLVYGSDESLMLSHMQQLLAVIYFSGPQLVVNHLLLSPIIAARFLDVLAICLSQYSVYVGSLEKLVLARPTATGYLPSLAELRNGIKLIIDKPSGSLDFPTYVEKEKKYTLEQVQKDFELPRMPPWFDSAGSQKLYNALAGILRLVGLSLMAATEFRSEGYFSVVADIPLGYLRKLVSELRKKELYKESWQSWYNETGSGYLLHNASVAACMLNEMMFGISNQSVDMLERTFKFRTTRDVTFSWKFVLENSAKSRFIDCVGNILHEYLSAEVWDLPMEQKPSLQKPNGEVEDITLHFFRDTNMLHQVIIDGIGIFSLCLGKDFVSSGFLHSSLYLLLENLICSNFQVKSASDAVLHVLAATSGYPTVGHLVVENADYVIDSICCQLRHLDLNPHAPNVLAAILSYAGVANKILPLLEEPIRSVSWELEILGRQQHPDLTIPFLKGVQEIAKASKHEANLMPPQALSFLTHVKTKMSAMEKRARNVSKSNSVFDDDTEILPANSELNDDPVQIEQCESILLELDDFRRYRRIVGSIAGSCLTTATPLLASAKQAACLVALDIIEDGIATLDKVEEAYKKEKDIKEALERVIQTLSYHHLKDTLDTADAGTDENRLLPAANKIWPFLVVCVRNENPVVVRRCLNAINNVVQICGGDFFSRRFQNDGNHFWRLLSSSPFGKKPLSKEDRAPLRLPYRSNNPISSECSISMAEVSSMKVQAAMLDMIADLSRSRKSASALEVVLKKVSGLVVGIACSGVSGLRSAALNALKGLSAMDSDLIWLLVADVYYSLKKKDFLPSPPTSDFPEVYQVLPPPLSSKGYLYVQYGGRSHGFDVDFLAVETVFKELESQVFNFTL